MPPRYETVIYLDIDGVLNVGIGDDENDTAPLLLNERNHKLALGMADTSMLEPKERDTVEKVMSVANTLIGHQECGTFSEFMCRGKDALSDVLLGRFAEIIREADQPSSVILASNWRKPKYRSQVRRLEERLSKHLGSEFTFDGTTEVVAESGAIDRLRCIGDHLKTFCSDLTQSDNVRALVLDDFFVTALSGWSCGDTRVRSEADVEAYLRRRAGRPGVVAKMVHCYRELQTRDGLRFGVGTGLTLERVAQAKAFVSRAACGDDCEVASCTTVSTRRTTWGNTARREEPSATLGKASIRLMSSAIARALSARPGSRCRTLPGRSVVPMETDED